MLNVKSSPGMTMKARKDDSGVARPTNMAVCTPMKNISTIVTRMKPMMIELTRSEMFVRVSVDWSFVITAVTFDGSFVR